MLGEGYICLLCKILRGFEEGAISHVMSAHDKPDRRMAKNYVKKVHVCPMCQEHYYTLTMCPKCSGNKYIENEKNKREN